MNSHSVVLLSNVSAAGNGSWVQWGGGEGMVSVDGTFGGTAFTLQYRSPDGTSGLTVAVMDSSGVFTNVSLSAEGGFLFNLPPGAIRGVLTGGSPANIYATAAAIPK